MLMPLNTSEASREHPSAFSTCCLYRTIQLSVGACEHCSWCRRSTPSEAYSCQDNILSPPCSIHHNSWHPWVGLTEKGWPYLWTLFHLGCDPSLQVCCQTGESESCTFISEELAGWIGMLHTPGRSWTPCSPNCARITGVLNTAEPLCSTSLEAEAIHIRRCAPTTRNFESIP